jgi:hypothetical protein
MGRIDSVKTGPLPRLADFFRWGIAIAESLTGSEAFKAGMQKNQENQVIKALESSVIAEPLIATVKTKSDKRIQKTSSELLAKLNLQADSLGIDTRQKLWPKNPENLSRQINRITASLKKAGISAYQDSRRCWIIEEVE